MSAPKRWIRFGKNEAPAEMQPHSWHKVREIRIATACMLDTATSERPSMPGAGAKICQACLEDPS